MVFQVLKGKDKKKEEEYATETVCPVEPEIFTKCPFTENVCCPCMNSLMQERTYSGILLIYREVVTTHGHEKMAKRGDKTSILSFVYAPVFHLTFSSRLLSRSVF